MVSVIVPVYKVEPYLARCVNSILAQTYRDFTLILVDDGSPDNCGLLCDEFAKQDNRIRVIHRENGGLSAARNSGLEWMYENLNCEWVTFIDSDDWVHPEMLASLLDAVKTSKLKIGICGYERTSGQTPQLPTGGISAEEWHPVDFYLSNVENATVAWGKLYHVSCFENMRYPIGKIHEDEFVTYQLLLKQDKVVVLNAPLYAYYVNTEGITKGTWKPNRLDAWEAYEQQLAFFEKNGYPELVKFRLRGYLENAMVQLEAAKGIHDGNSVRFVTKRIRNLIRRCWHAGLIHFQYDFEILYRFYPLTTKLYRFYLEKIKK